MSNIDDTELAAILAATTGEVKTFITAQAAANDKILADYRELKQRTLDLEQKGAHRHATGPTDDGGSIMPAFELSEGFKALLKGETKSARIAVPASALQRKAMIGSIISGGAIGAPDRSGAIIAPSQRRLFVRDLLPALATGAGSTEFVRELAYTSAAASQYGGSPAQIEGAQKAESQMTLELINSPVVTIAHYFTVSRQALDDSAALAQHLDSRGIYGWQLELDRQLLAGVGTSGTLNGLINQAAAFTRGGTGVTPLDAVRKAITQLALGDHVATGVVLNPTDAEGLELAKDGQQRYMDVVVYTNGQPAVWRLPIIESNAMATGTFLVGDFALAALVRDRQEAHVEISLDHADYRTRNLALVLIEGRVGLEVHRPTAIVTGSF